MMTHRDRIAVVTGAACGIGQAVAVGLAERGASIAGIDLQESNETGEKVRDAGGEWHGLVADVSSAADVHDAAASVLEHFGYCDILVNNAGIFPSCPFDQLSFEEWRRILSVNLDSQFLVSQAFVPSMIERRWGRIVNLTSGSVQIPAEGVAAYKASKMGVIGLTRGMSADLGRYGITVNAASPSLTRTPGVLAGKPAGMLDTIANMQAIKRVAEPQDVVGLILFLTSEDSHFVTGQTILADGGLCYF